MTLFHDPAGILTICCQWYTHGCRDHDGECHGDLPPGTQPSSGVPVVFLLPVSAALPLVFQERETEHEDQGGDDQHGTRQAGEDGNHHHHPEIPDGGEGGDNQHQESDDNRKGIEDDPPARGMQGGMNRLKGRGALRPFFPVPPEEVDGIVDSHTDHDGGEQRSGHIEPDPGNAHQSEQDQHGNDQRNDTQHSCPGRFKNDAGQHEDQNQCDRQ